MLLKLTDAFDGKPILIPTSNVAMVYELPVEEGSEETETLVKLLYEYAEGCDEIIVKESLREIWTDQKKLLSP